MKRYALLVTALLTCLHAQSPQNTQFSKERILNHIKVLSSDEFEGRGPGTLGEEKATAYIEAYFKQCGLLPGNPNGSFIQNVPLIGITSKTETTFQIGDKKINPVWINDYVATSHRAAPQVEVNNSEIIFCGYGVVAPEYNWNDFKDVDVRGKTIVVLVNDPPVPDPKDPTKLDEKVFKGKAMTYYGRWMYKYEEASALGAAACLIVHETGPAGYPFAVIAASQGRENFDLRRSDGNMGHVAVEGWLTLDGAKNLFKEAGYDYEALKASAVSRDFRPVTLKAKASFFVKNTVRDVASKNVVAKLEGSNPKLKDEYVIYSSHWDHLGRDSKLKGDQIFHGAADNASGTAALLELAHAYANLKPADRPKRSILFLSVTAEEKGLLGSRFYAQNPLYPLTKTLADLNIDGINVYGKTLNMVSVGLGSSTLDEIAAEIGKEHGRSIRGEQFPERGTYYRSDHFEFARVGVPSCMIRGGTLFEGHDADYGRALEDDYTTNRYHKVTDVIQPDWTMEGSVQDTETLFDLGIRVAKSTVWPTWAPNNEFKAKRDAMMANPGQ
jgi:Zn-dependent M28 family amino/carboxypeptidase